MDIGSITDLVKKKLTLVASGVAFVASAGLYVLHMDKQADLDSQFGQQNLTLSRMLKDLKNSSGLEEDIANAESRLEQVDTRLFDSQELATNYNYFYNIESKTGVKLSGLRQVETGDSNPKTGKDAPAGNLYKNIQYHMTIVGEFRQIVGFLRELEGGASFYRLEKFGLSQVGGAKGDGESLVMDVSLYMLGRKES